jgi:choline dehydrogenase-like flavoprotein
MIEKGDFINLEKKIEFSTHEMITKYKNAGLTAMLGSPVINYVEGSCVGGGSEVNSGLYHRIPDDVLKSWEDKNNIIFDRYELNEAYEFVEKELSISPMPKHEMPEASKILQMGSDKLGWKCSEIPRWYKYNENGSSKRQSMTETLIPNFLRLGGELQTSTEVLKLKKTRTNKNSITIKNLTSGEIKVIESDYVVISCGAIDSAHLLLKSGIHKNIGNRLKAHPSFKFIALFDYIINKKNMGVPVHQVKEFAPDISMGCSISNKQFIGLGLNDSNNIKHINEWEKMSSYYTSIKPKGHGKIFNLPFYKSPLVKFKLHKEDVINLKKGAMLLAELLINAGAKKLFPSFKNGIPISSFDEIKSLENVNINNFNLMTIHLFSSIQMGGNPKSFPLSPEGHLWIDPSIYVADSSILCDSPSVNPQGTIMAISKTIADRLLNKIKNEI